MRMYTWSELIYLALRPSPPHDATMYFFRFCRTYSLSSCVYRVTLCFHSASTFSGRLSRPIFPSLHCRFIPFSIFPYIPFAFVCSCLRPCVCPGVFIKIYQRINLVFNQHDKAESEEAEWMQNWKRNGRNIGRPSRTHGHTRAKKKISY